MILKLFFLQQASKMEKLQDYKVLSDGADSVFSSSYGPPEVDGHKCRLELRR